MTLNGDLIPEDDFKKCMKKPISVRATKMRDDFFVKTPEGVMEGDAGDYLMIGIDGERYPCKKEIFEKSYDWISSITTERDKVEVLVKQIDDEFNAGITKTDYAYHNMPTGEKGIAYRYDIFIEVQVPHKLEGDERER